MLALYENLHTPPLLNEKKRRRSLRLKEVLLKAIKALQGKLLRRCPHHRKLRLSSLTGIITVERPTTIYKRTNTTENHME